MTVSCVLFIQMGLSGAIQERLKLRSEIMSCPKCASFWSVLAYLLVTGNRILPSVATSFVSSYCALWLSLLYDALAKLYNACYDAISETTDTSKDAKAGTAEDATGYTDEVSQM